jgi:hypothetical protein
MNAPHREIRCAACGAAPLWFETSSEDARPVPLCARCAGASSQGATYAASAAPLPWMPTPQPAKGSTVPTAWALAAVMVASFLPQAAVALDRHGARIHRAIRAASSALEDDGSPTIVWVSRPRTAPFARPSAWVATPSAPVRTRELPTAYALLRRGAGEYDGRGLPLAGTRDEDDTAAGGLRVTMGVSRVLPPALGLREGDVVTRINGRLARDTGHATACITGAPRFVVVEGFRDGARFVRSLPCSELRWPSRQRVAPRARALLTAQR